MNSGDSHFVGDDDFVDADIMCLAGKVVAELVGKLLWLLSASLSALLLWRRGLRYNVSCPHGALPQEEWEVTARRQQHLRAEAAAVRNSRVRAQRRDGQHRQTPATRWLELKRFKQAS